MFWGCWLRRSKMQKRVVSKICCSNTPSTNLAEFSSFNDRNIICKLHDGLFIPPNNRSGVFIWRGISKSSAPKANGWFLCFLWSSQILLACRRIFSILRNFAKCLWRAGSNLLLSGNFHYLLFSFWRISENGFGHLEIIFDKQDRTGAFIGFYAEHLC